MDIIPTQHWQLVIKAIEALIYVKNAMKTHGAPKTLTKTIPFEVKSYRAWQHLLEKTQDIDIDTSNNKLTTKNAIKILENQPFEFSKKLIAKVIEVVETGKIKDVSELATEYNINIPSELIDISNGTTNISNGDNIIKNVADIEAVPKKLAEEGARPGDDKPIEQRRYDLQLIWGIGPRVAEKMEADGLTLSGLLNEWQVFSKKDSKKGYTLDPSILKITISGQKTSDIHKRLSDTGCKQLAKLTHDQILGVKYYHDIGAKIPRAEIEKIEKVLSAVAIDMNPAFIVQCCGSYRRGRARSGDVDCLLFHKDLNTAEDVHQWEINNGHILSAFAAKLANLGFLVDHLSCGDTKYMGLCKLFGNNYTINRRIDIRLIPMNSYASALLYFTGSKNLNTDMRNRALARGMTLNEYGLYKFARDPKGVIIKDSKGKVLKGEQVKTESEADIFKAVGMDYLEPSQRDI